MGQEVFAYLLTEPEGTSQPHTPLQFVASLPLLWQDS